MNPTLVMPCPFCGKDEISVHEGSTFRWVYAACDNCGAQAGEVRVNTMIPKAEAAPEADKRALAEWNKRV